MAPFLTLDGNPYPVVANGQILWVVDGYTTTDLYPYSERISMPQATSTSQTPDGAVAGQLTGEINYIRNSVKAVVNAYTGAVTLYQWGPADPMLQHLDEGVPRRHQAEAATSRPTCCRTCATRRTCSRSSGRSWPSTTS